MSEQQPTTQPTFAENSWQERPIKETKGIQNERDDERDD
jgi:hypothetical protein